MTLQHRPSPPRRRLGLGPALLLCVLAMPAWAGGHDDHADEHHHDSHGRDLSSIRAAVERGELVPLPRIMELALARVPGDIVKTELRADHERLTYVVKILTGEARVIEVDLDARTGAVQRVEKD
jgi:uncharacterized membrane protein YkoI